ncbi:hypothetical protein HY214_00675, partial [Candidatus Roizmanbacteria bacterium]|nr:hypothetical protein [Candidatus Roizmanbacteria bacterium]
NFFVPQKKSGEFRLVPKFIVFGLIGSFLVNLAGNLHTIYLFTKGYPNEHPVPFWQILSSFNPTKYWYPNATRFIPFTIHEFPSYSYVVADLHGHVFDIPVVLLTLLLLFQFYTTRRHHARQLFATIIGFGFLTAVHYMTNAFDGPIYLLLTLTLLFSRFGRQKAVFGKALLLLGSFIIFSWPFSSHFSPFVSGIGLNCAPSLLVKLHKIGPFLFENDKCQTSSLWMLGVLWGFFLLSFILYNVVLSWRAKELSSHEWGRRHYYYRFIYTLFLFGIFLLIVPEFFYIKDIYPAHFRANTMFKLGYQTFIMMALASTLTFFEIKSLKKRGQSLLLTGIFLPFFFLVSVYPLFSVPSYYGLLKKPPELRGDLWLKSTYPADYEIIKYLNTHISGQPVILEAQGDSYTDYERISAFTGLPTVAGWWVHEWLWRGSPNYVGERVADVSTIYESTDRLKTRSLLAKYRIRYIIISVLERQKYTQLNIGKLTALGPTIFTTEDGTGMIVKTEVVF